MTSNKRGMNNYEGSTDVNGPLEDSCSNVSFEIKLKLHFMGINPLVETFWFGSYFHEPHGFNNNLNFLTWLWRLSKRQKV